MELVGIFAVLKGEVCAEKPRAEMPPDESEEGKYNGCDQIPA